jgi:hypothetical protein
MGLGHAQYKKRSGERIFGVPAKRPSMRRYEGQVLPFFC